MRVTRNEDGTEMEEKVEQRPEDGEYLKSSAKARAEVAAKHEAEAMPTVAPNSETDFAAHDWFRPCFGVTEHELMMSRENWFAHGRFKNGWQAGRFTWPSVAELVQQVDALPAAKDPPRTELVVEDGVDIGKLQAKLTTEDRAMVQIASNFNCLECASRVSLPDGGRLVSGYAADCTQGPAASFGVPAASLLRCHYAFYDAEGDPSRWGQTAERQVELLADVRQYFGTCVNGKMTWDGKEDELKAGQVGEVSQAIRVGVHEDAQVIFSKWRRTLTKLPEPFPLVDQVLVASANWGDSGMMPSKKQLEHRTRAALRAAYDGAYLAAILRGRHLLLLTLVGGGSFSNPIAMVLDELAAAHKRWRKHPASVLRKVQLCVYEEGSAKSIQKMLRT